MLRKFMVMRNDAIRTPNNRYAIRDSDAWPCIVELDCEPGADVSEAVVREAYRRFWPETKNLPLDRPFFIIELNSNTKILEVEFKRRQQFDTVVRPIHF